MCFDDCYDYTELMGSILFSPDWFEKFGELYRPFTIPVVYSFFGNLSTTTKTYIVYFQVFLSFISWMILCCAMTSLATSNTAKIVVFILTSLMIFGRGGFLFNQFLLSDSMSLSLLALWTAATLRYDFFLDWVFRAPNQIYRFERGGFILLAFIFLSILTSGARDSNSLLMLAVIPLTSFRIFRVSKLFSILVAITIAACVIHVHTGTTNRSMTNSVNIAVGFVLPTEDARNYFLDAGVISRSVAKLPELTFPIQLRDADFIHQMMERRKLFERYSNEHQLTLTKLTWSSFLITHPFFTIGNLIQERSIIFSPDMTLLVKQSSRSQPGDVLDPNSFPIPAMPGYISLVDLIPGDVLLALGLLLLPLSLLWARRKESYLVFAGCWLMFAGATNCAISFHGDYWELSEMGRHCFTGSVFLRLGIVLLSAAIISKAADKRQFIDARAREST